MNINLVAAASKQQNKNNAKSQRSFEETNKNLSYGLNKRSSAGNSAKNQTGKKKKRSIFDSADSDGDSDDNDYFEGNDRQEVNRAIIAEQKAKREAANAILSSQGGADSSIYDYDGAYESFSSDHKAKDLKGQKQQPEKKESKYISNLLKTAKRRQFEREVVLERKVAKEQLKEEEEMNSEEFSGKERFVTKAYKQKLAEREAWAKEDELMEKENEKGSKSIVAGFYGNFNRNIAIGNQGSAASPSHTEHKDNNDGKENSKTTHSNDIISGNMRMYEGFHETEHDDPSKNETHMGEANNTHSATRSHISDHKIQMHFTATQSKESRQNTEQSLRQQRMQKILDARERYFERKQ